VNAGCDVVVTNADTGGRTVLTGVYTDPSIQMHDTGRFRWEANDPGCRVTRHPGPGTAVLPFVQKAGEGDTDAFAAPERIAVEVLDFNGNPGCGFELRDAADGRRLDLVMLRSPGAGPRNLNPSGRPRVYLAGEPCTVRISAG
jgi:hypothetical protein